MATTTTMSKWGNGVGVLIPKSVREEAGIGLRDRVRIDVKDGIIMLYREDAGWTLHELMSDYDGPTPEYVDLGEPLGQEVW